MPGHARMRAGFSLVEMLVVVLIIGLMTGVAVLSLNIADSHPARHSALQLAEILRTASEEAGIEGRSLALGFWQRGWRFYELRAGVSWQPLQDDALLRARQLPDGVHLALQLQGEDVHLQHEDKTHPQVFLLASGEMQPFVLELRDGHRAPMWLHGNAIGQVRVLDAQGKELR